MPVSVVPFAFLFFLYIFAGAELNFLKLFRFWVSSPPHPFHSSPTVSCMLPRGGEEYHDTTSRKAIEEPLEQSTEGDQACTSCVTISATHLMRTSAPRVSRPLPPPSTNTALQWCSCARSVGPPPPPETSCGTAGDAHPSATALKTMSGRTARRTSLCARACFCHARRHSQTMKRGVVGSKITDNYTVMLRASLTKCLVYPTRSRSWHGRTVVRARSSTRARPTGAILKAAKSG